ncbi:adenylate/guanylate cyclase domain-containing protein [Leptolyngbya iicbica LK]|uniref:Adenylate/guanylate cyclase domain-containing protein n=1 Tax=Leptolyngbya iicbica LK TaxID=2294035 RepID=A0A4Q7E0H6_9CYAN|nr:adenylate/guanylate cyclase domain-containing protein [Leptolyngbya sp. LK]
MAMTSLAATSLILGLKQLSKVESLELMAYDRMMQMRGDAPLDERLLIVGINERDIETQRVTPPDQILAGVLRTLQQHHPRVIGLDLHRNAPQPPGWDDLLAQMQAENVVVITKLGDTVENTIPPPPTLPPDQVGFNDLPIDPDGAVRRSLLLGSNQDGVFYSFALRLALRYLADEGIQPQGSAANPEYLQLGESVFVPLEPNAGGYHRIDSGGYQILLDYRRNEAIAPHISLTDVLENRFDPDLVTDRIVLIGTTATSLKDLFFTPYSMGQQDGQKMAGVEIHAQMVSQILDAAQGSRPLFWFWPLWLEIFWMWIWAVGGGTMAWFVRRPLVLGLGSVALLIGVSGIGYGVFLHHGWIPIIAPALTLGLSTGTIIMYRAQQAQQQQKMVMTLLGQSTSPEIAEALWESRDRLLRSGKLPGQRLIATMLFSDIREFSTLAEKLPPEDLLDWLNEYLDEMVGAVKEHRGIVNKFTGDGLLAVFGVPVPRTTPEEIAHDAQQAVRCALAMGDRLAQLNQDWTRRGLANARMRVGIFTGPVVVGSLGGQDRLEYGVIGDSVNTAARLESCLKTRQPGICRILIAHETLEHLHNQFQVESWGDVELKGKELLADVYRVIGPAGGDDSADGDAVP